MKFILFLWFILFNLNVIAQKPIVLNATKLYLVTRSTENKQNIIAKDFNIKDSLSTHIGIGYFENQKFKIYNVSNVEVNTNGSSLIIDSYESFINLKDFKYCSIWSCVLEVDKMNKFKQLLKTFEDKELTFDHEFDLKNNSFYCSEFVFNVLKLLDEIKFNFKPQTIILTDFYQNVLKREKLTYIPVDFFQTNQIFTIEYEKYK